MLVSIHPFTPPIDLKDIPVILPTISAMLAGSVAGIRFSPVSDITILSSTTTGTKLMDHVKSQQAYTAPIFIASCGSFLSAGLLRSFPVYINILISLSIGLLIAIALLYLFNFLQKRKISS